MKLQLFQPQGTRNGCFWVPSLTASLPLGQRCPQLRGLEGRCLVGRCHHSSYTVGLTSMQKTRPMAAPWLLHVHPLLSPIKQSSSLLPELVWLWGGGGDARTSAVGWRATGLDGAGPDYPLSILSWPKVTSCPQINSSCESKGSYLGPHSRCGWATMDSSLPQCGFFSSSRRPCPIPPLQALLARHNVLWKSSRPVASLAKTPKS